VSFSKPTDSHGSTAIAKGEDRKDAGLYSRRERDGTRLRNPKTERGFQKPYRDFTTEERPRGRGEKWSRERNLERKRVSSKRWSHEKRARAKAH